MKVEWHVDDIRPGRIVGKPQRGERWMIGYFTHRDDDRRWTLNSLSDGLVQEPVTKAEMVVKLNQSGDLPVELFDAKAL